MKEFFRELRARWGEKINAFWAKMLQAAIWASGLQAVFLGILENPTITMYAAPWLLAFLKIGLSVSVTAALVAKLTVADSKSLERKLHEKDLHIEKKGNNPSGKGAALLLLLLLLLLPACTTFQKCQDKYGTIVKDTLHVPVTIAIPKDSAVLRYEIRRIPLNIPIFSQSENGARITLTKTEKAGQEFIEAQADCPEKEVKKIVPVPYEKIVFQCPEKKPWEVWQNWLIGLLLIANGTLLYLLLQKAE